MRQGRDERLSGENRLSKEAGNGLAGWQAHQVAAEEVSDRKAGGNMHDIRIWVVRALNFSESVLELEGEVGEANVYLPRHLRRAAPVGRMHEALPLDDPILRQRVGLLSGKADVLAELSGESREREQRTEIRRREVEVIVVEGPDHRMSEPVGGRRELHWHEQVVAVLDPPISRPVRHHVR